MTKFDSLDHKSTAQAMADARAEGAHVAKSNAIAKLRFLAGVSQVELASRLGVQQSTVSRAESQPDPQLSSLARYFTALGAKLELTAVMDDGERVVFDDPTGRSNLEGELDGFEEAPLHRDERRIMGSGNDNDRIVQKRPDNKWEVVKEGHKRASVVTDTQKEAIDAARPIVRNAGGGELRTKGAGGKIRDSDTIAPGHESPTKDKR